MNTQIIEPSVIAELLRYEPEAGELFWLPRSRALFSDDRGWKSWNTKYANKPAFTAIDTYGYHHGHVFRRLFRAHRVAWVLHYGEWPKLCIDHINGIKSDNRISNLRQATHSQNSANSAGRSSSGLRMKGAYYSKRDRIWISAITANGNRVYLGCFKTEQEAHAAYCNASAEIHGEFGRVA